MKWNEYGSKVERITSSENIVKLNGQIRPIRTNQNAFIVEF